MEESFENVFQYGIVTDTESVGQRDIDVGRYGEADGCGRVYRGRGIGMRSIVLDQQGTRDVVVVHVVVGLRTVCIVRAAVRHGVGVRQGVGGRGA